MESRSPLRERLGMYLLGLAIGFILLGFIYMAKRQAATQSSAPAPTPAPTAPR